MKVSLGVGMLEHDGPSIFSLTKLAREMRKEPTPSERILWRYVCGGRLGVRVRRQHPLPPFIADFFIASHKLVVEVDGGSHRGREAHDAARDVWLARCYGVRVLRIDAELVERDVCAAVALIRVALG